MFVNKSSLLANFFTVIVLICFSSLLVSVGHGELVEVHDPKIDVALLYDQSSSMDEYASHIIWGDMSQWIRNYFAGSDANQTQFAVLGCEEGKKSNSDHKSLKPVLYLNGNHREGAITSKPDKAQMVIIDGQDFVQTHAGKEFGNNPIGYLHATAKKIFQENMGDREDAQNVVLYVTDRTMFATLDNEKIVKALGVDTAFLFICVKQYTLPKWLNKLSWYLFKDYPGLVQRLNEMLMKKKKINVTHCKPSGKIETGCVLQSNSSCFNFMYPIIIDFPDPPQHANHTGCENETIKCDPTKCLTTAGPSTSTMDLSSGRRNGGKGTDGIGIVGIGTGGTEIGGTEAGGTGTGGTEIVGTEIGGTGTGGTGIGGTGTGGTGTRGTGTYGTETGGTETVGTRTGRTETGRTGTVGTRTGGTEIDGTGTVGTGTGGTETGGTGPDARDKASPVPSSSTPMIIGVVIGVVLLLIVFVVILVVVVSRRKRKAVPKAKGKGESLEAKRVSEKDKGMKVDLLEDLTMIKGGKSKAEKSMTNKKTDKSTVRGKEGKSTVTKELEPTKHGKPKSTPKSSGKRGKK